MAIQINGSGSITGITTRLAAAAAPAGSVIQCLQDVKSDVFTTGSNTPVDVTGWSQEITTTGSNKVLVQVTCGVVSMATGGYSAELYLVRGSTTIAIGDQVGSNRTRVTMASNGASNYDLSSPSIIFLDSPGAGTHTYKVQMATQDGNGTACLNQRGDDSDNTSHCVSTSTLTVMEIAQ
tara:strand:- start:1270 stop:1806 length:537 start_codon:yes stop_codon:yes gene_type:complete